MGNSVKGIKVDSIISDEDMRTISEIAEKYNLDIFGLTEILMSKQSKRTRRVSIRVSDDEMKIIENNIKILGVSNAEYLRMAARWFVESGMSEKVTSADFPIGRAGDKKHRLAYPKDDLKITTAMNQCAERIGGTISEIIRYSCINYPCKRE